MNGIGELSCETSRDALTMCYWIAQPGIFW